MGVMNLFPHNMDEGLALAARVDPKYAPAWLGRSPAEQAALATYFLPHHSAKTVLGVTRPRVVKWYCPFADQHSFPSGHRYCINVYTGCSHGCVYCYAAGYLAMDAKPKAGFRRLLLKDLDDLDVLDVPPAPVHLSNSTDALQEPLESERGDTLFTLQQLARYRHRFTTVTVLTKNPAVLARGEYLAALHALHTPQRPVVLEISLAFWREQTAAAYDPGAPILAVRLEAIRQLRAAGLPVVLRISPTYPIGIVPPGQSCPQTTNDVEHLAVFAREVGCHRLVHTPAKIVRPQQGQLHPLMESMLTFYRRLAGRSGLDFRGGSWRLPQSVAEQYIVQPLREICSRQGVHLFFCKKHLLTTS
jgi:DNA repair photolyase